MHADHGELLIVRAKEHGRPPPIGLCLPDDPNPARIGQILHGPAQRGQTHLCLALQGTHGERRSEEVAKDGTVQGHGRFLSECRRLDRIGMTSRAIDKSF